MMPQTHAICNQQGWTKYQEQEQISAARSVTLWVVNGRVTVCIIQETCVRGNSEWSIHHVEGPDLCSLSSFRGTRSDLPKDPSNLTQLQPKVLKLFIVCCDERKMCEFRQQGCCCCTSQHQLKTLVSWYVIFILIRFFLICRRTQYRKLKSWLAKSVSRVAFHRVQSKILWCFLLKYFLM